MRPTRRAMSPVRVTEFGIMITMLIMFMIMIITTTATGNLLRGLRRA